jgi:hypothetical protein
LNIPHATGRQLKRAECGSGLEDIDAEKIEAPGATHAPMPGSVVAVAVTEGEVKKAMLSGGWREDRVQQLSKEAYAVRFRRR